ncbi:MAG: HD domain-containing protein [Actinobacteria bacterium]|nr:HD domain-containing protein [Actinomycetota bacterium]
MNKEHFSNTLFKTIGHVADENNVKVYVVGGYVRDVLLGKESKDLDFVVVGDGPYFAKKVARRLNATQVTIYKKFGTAMIVCNDQVLEFVGARAESYRGDSRKPTVQSADLMADLSRRDFTINAMAVALNDAHFGEIIDPYDGQMDLQNKIIRTPLKPKKTFFDDPLRIMRAIRFACQLQFELNKTTKAGLKKEAARLKIISQERITDELMKILASQKPSSGFHLMDETGVLEIILPEIAALKGVEEMEGYRHKDVFYHTLKVIDNVAAVSDDLRLRFVALYHDVAKPSTKQFKPGTGWTFHGHDDLGARMMKSIGRRLRISNGLLQYTQKMIRLHLRPIHLAEEGVTDSAIRRLLFFAGEDVDDLMVLCRADITSGNPQRVAKHLANFDHVVERMEEVEAKDQLRQFQPPVRGDEIMQTCGLQPGPMVGKIKKAIEEAILEGDIPNEHDAAFEYMLKIKDDILGEG